MTIPGPDLGPPAFVLRLAAGGPVTPVWANELGGVTWRLGDGESYLKYGPHHPEFDTAGEAVRLDWLGGFDLPTPTLLGRGTDGPNTWLHTAGLAGISAVEPAFVARADETVPLLGRALRAFHDALPVDACPFSWSAAERLARKDSMAMAALRTAIPELDPVVCHGDACNPNFLLAEPAGLACTGYVDLGRVGVADRWADLAPAVLSLSWNFPGVDRSDAFLAGYGIARDEAKLAFYTHLWEAE